MASILDMVRGALGPDVIERVGGLIGENTTVTRRALDSAVARPRHSSAREGACCRASSVVRPTA